MKNKNVQPPAYFRNIQALRAVAALLVLAFHTYAVEGKYFGHHAVPTVLGMFGTCGVDLFFVISGFVMTTVTRGRFGTGETALGFLKRRVLRIYPTYWFYSFVVLAVMLVMPQWVNASSGHHADILRSFLLLPSGTLPLLLQGWTLTYEMFFYLVFALMIACVAERFLAHTLIAWAIVTCCLAYWLAHTQVSSPVLDLVSNPLVLEFVAGCFCALLWPHIRGWWPTFISAAGVAAIVFAFLMGDRVGFDTVIRWRSVYFGVPAFLLVLGATALEGHAERSAPRPLCVLGDASYSLYLSHVLVISAVGRLYARFAPASLPAYFGTVLCVVLAIATGYASFRLIEQPVNSLLKRALRRSVALSTS